jgi:transposase
MKRPARNQYSSEFKAQVIELVKHGKPVPEAAKEFGIGTGILYRWTRRARQAEQLGSEGLRAVGEEAEVEELLRLRAENADLRLENDILKKAAVILGTKPQAKRAI